MITENKFLTLVDLLLEYDLNDNVDQKNVVIANHDEDQFIVAGPGSGKTTSLVLKILKYIFVDDIPLDNILITTFTKKAAKEIKDRLYNCCSIFSNHLNIEFDFDMDNLLIGTLDSIAEEIVSYYFDVDIIDNFTSSAIMMQTLLTDERNNDKKLKHFFKKLKNNEGGVTTSDMNIQIQSIKDRIYYDMIDFNLLKNNADKEKLLYEIIGGYIHQLETRNVMDYAMLENKFYEVLSSKQIDRLKNISVILVDEYQDTNLLQEQIYFKLAKYAKENNGNITVVGDDDQSLYRFRGATISLFTNYVKNISKVLSISPKIIYLQNNYRSTTNIIDFNNEFVHMDEKYLKSRTMNKPPISSVINSQKGLPVLGMFRSNIEELSTDLSNLIYDLKIGNSHTVTRYDKEYDIKSLKDNPSIAVLMNSPREISAFNKKRLPYYIRETLSYKDEDIVVFNPRGQSFETTEIVSLICGLLLQMVDPNGKIEEQIDNLPPHSKKTLKSWRKHAITYLNENNKEFNYINHDIILKEVLDDILNESNNLANQSNENKLYQDIIVDTLTQTDKAINIEGKLSANQIFWHILIPIASGAIQIDDDMFDVDLKDNVNIMSIHQSKGLEFDVVIVDVGSDIYNNSRNTAFKRFPRNGGRTYNIEEYMRRYSPLSDDNISGLDKAFDDLIRKYFVAYTRAKSILILVGLNNMRYGYNSDFQKNILIPNVATGWSRDSKWHWDSLDNLLQI